MATLMKEIAEKLSNSDVIINNIVNTYGDILVCIESELHYHDAEDTKIYSLIYDKEIGRTYIINAVHTPEELTHEINTARNTIVNTGFLVSDAATIASTAIDGYIEKCPDFNFDKLQKNNQYFLHCKDNVYRTVQPGIHFSIPHSTYMIVYERYESDRVFKYIREIEDFLSEKIFHDERGTRLRFRYMTDLPKFEIHCEDEYMVDTVHVLTGDYDEKYNDNHHILIKLKNGEHVVLPVNGPIEQYGITIRPCECGSRGCSEPIIHY